jgi:hypothetical protein
VRGALLVAADVVSGSLRCPGVAPGRPALAGRPARPAAHGRHRSGGSGIRAAQTPAGTARRPPPLEDGTTAVQWTGRRSSRRPALHDRVTWLRCGPWHRRTPEAWDGGATGGPAGTQAAEPLRASRRAEAAAGPPGRPRLDGAVPQRAVRLVPRRAARVGRRRPRPRTGPGPLDVGRHQRRRPRRCRPGRTGVGPPAVPPGHRDRSLPPGWVRTASCRCGAVPGCRRPQLHGHPPGSGGRGAPDPSEATGR